MLEKQPTDDKANWKKRHNCSLAQIMELIYYRSKLIIYLDTDRGVCCGYGHVYSRFVYDIDVKIILQHGTCCRSTRQTLIDCAFCQTSYTHRTRVSCSPSSFSFSFSVVLFYFISMLPCAPASGIQCSWYVMYSSHDCG